MCWGNQMAKKSKKKSKAKRAKKQANGQPPTAGECRSNCSACPAWHEGCYLELSEWEGERRWASASERGCAREVLPLSPSEQRDALILQQLFAGFNKGRKHSRKRCPA